MSKEKLKSWKEARRFKAMELLEQGWTQEQIAKAFGIHQSTVSSWKKLHRIHGDSGLLLQGHPGKKSRLSDAQKELLKSYLDQGASAHGFIGDFWTQKRVSRMIVDEFSIVLQPRSCGDLLKSLDYILKKPQLKSYQQNPEKVKQWKEETIPEIKKKQNKEML